jgi:type I restriction enzyme M protein
LSGVRYSWCGDKASIDIFWLKDESLEASDNFPDPDVLAQEIVEDLEAAQEQFRAIVGDLDEKNASSYKE